MNKSKAWVGVISFAWLFVVVTIYFANHKPFSPTLLRNLLVAAWQIVVAFGVICVAAGLGRRILALGDFAPLVRLVLQAALGIGFVSTMSFIMGVTVGYQPLWIEILLVIAIVMLQSQIRGWLSDWLSLYQFWISVGLMGKMIAVGTLVIAIGTLSVALTPPLRFDTLVYHLALPHAYLDAGRFVYIPWNIFWGMPQIAESLYTLTMSLAGAPSATALGWLFGVLTLVGVLGYIGQYIGGIVYGWVGVASLLAGFTLSSSIAWGYVDWLTMLFGLGFLIMLDRWRVSEEREYLLLSGAFAGLAVGTKYTAGILVLSGVGLVVLTASFSERFWKNLLQFVLSAGIFGLPWMVKNLVATKNPVYPFIFPSGAMDNIRLALYQEQAPWGNWLDAALLPLRATFSGVDGAPGYSASIGPLLLGFGAISWVGLKHVPSNKRTVIETATVVAISGVIVWIIAGRVSGLLIQSRLYFSVFPAFAVLAAGGYKALSDIKTSFIRISRLASSLVLLVFWLNVVKTGLSTWSLGSSQVLFGLRTSEQYLADNLGWYWYAMQGLSDLPNGSKVMMLWEARSLYCIPICVPDEIIDRWAYDRASLNDPERILQSWRAAGYTHVLYYKAGADFVRREDSRYQADDWLDLDQLLSHLPLDKDFGGAYLLYSLSP